MRLILLLTLVVAVATVLGSSPVPVFAEDPVGPTDYEQYMLELVNRTRADPDAEAARHGIDLNEGLAPGTITNEAREPLAVDLDVLTAARLHNEDLFANFKNLPPDHRGSDGKDPTGRVSAQTTDFLGGVAENNSWKTGDKMSAKLVDGLHALLFKDFTSKFEVVGRGHRKVMLNGTRDMVGIGVGMGNFGGKKAGIATQDFITTAKLHLTGVAYVDGGKKDGFYTPGEGLGGLAVQAVRDSDGATFNTTTWASGGYTLAVPPGTWTVTGSGAGIDSPVVKAGIVVTDRNVKVDFMPAAATPPPPPPPPPPPAVFSLTKGTAKLSKKTGDWTLAVKKAAFNHGSWTFTTPDVDALVVKVNGDSYFDLASRAGAIVKLKVDKKLGKVSKITIKTPDKNKLTLDLKKSRMKLSLKTAPTFDPAGGSVTVEVILATQTGTLTSTATITGTKRNKALLAPATGTVTEGS